MPRFESPPAMPCRWTASGCLVPVMALLLLAGCGGGTSSRSSQVAAKVNKEEISVHQVNFVLQQQRVPAEQSAQAGKQALERLIEQELAIQRAGELRIDREPEVLQQLEAARREIVARAYWTRIAEAAVQPTAEEVSGYYAANPSLFGARRVYRLQEVAVEATPEQVAALRERLVALHGSEAVLGHLKAAGLRYSVNEVTRAAEQLPIGMLKPLAEMNDGDSMLSAAPGGAQLLVRMGFRTEPIDEAGARPAIERYLLNERKRQVVAKDLETLRAGAKIEYVGSFAAGAASGPERAAMETKQ